MKLKKELRGIMKQSNKKSFFILLQTFLLELQLYFIVCYIFIL